MLKARILVPLVLLAAATIFFYGQFRAKSGPVKYRFGEISRGRIQSQVSATGTLNPVEQVEIGSQVSGTLQSVRVDYNSKVRAGQVLAQIDPALLAATKSQVEANVSKAKVALLDAERAAKRAHDLSEKGLVSQVELDGADVTLAQRRADLQQAEAAMELAAVNLRNTTITSPISGIVISRNIDVGQTVAASLQAPKLFVIAKDLTEMQLEARVDEADIGQVEVGQPVTFTVDSYPDRVFRGHVLQIRAEPIVESGVVSYVVVVRVANPDQKLLPGMTANVTIVTASRESALCVPNAALRFRPPAPGGTGTAGAATRMGGGRKMTDGASEGRRASTLYVLKEGRPNSVELRTGITDGTRTEIVASSLPEGTQVILGIEEAPTDRRSGTPNPLGGPVRMGGGGRR